jgi:hypothetical protein
VFVFSLICLYTCSTLAHSFHRMKLTGTLFIVCAVAQSKWHHYPQFPLHFLCMHLVSNIIHKAC